MQGAYDHLKDLVSATSASSGSSSDDAALLDEWLRYTSLQVRDAGGQIADWTDSLVRGTSILQAVSYLDIQRHCLLCAGI